MSDSNDHDLLIEIKTTVKMLADGQGRFFSELRDLTTRVATLEAKDKGDSEKVHAITKDVQESLNNSKRISEAFIELTNIKDDVKELKTKNSIFDWVNLAIASIVGVISYILHGKPSP